MASNEISIECDRCSLQNSRACRDCVVTFVLGRDADDAIIIDADEERTLRLLEKSGLLPALLFTDKVG